MTHATASVEPFSSDAVMVEAPDAQKSTTEESPSTVRDKSPEKEENAEEDEEPLIELVPRNDRIPGPPPPRPFRRGRSPPYYNPNANPDYIAMISNTKQFNTLLSEPDTCIETIASSQVTYITTHPFHASDLEKLSWLFKIGIPDAWVQKPTSFLSSAGFQFDLPSGRRPHGYDPYDDGYNTRDVVPIARLGAALRVFKSDDSETAKVKFVTAVQGKSNPGWVKLLVSHTRQAAAVDIFHEILNNHSVLFVGAVLQDVAIPVEAPSRHQQVKIQRVGSLKEAEEVGEGVVGFIC
jgi:hypothetical protein